MYVPVQIVDEVFLMKRVTFLKKLDLLYDLISYQDVYHSGLHQNICYFLSESFFNRVLSLSSGRSFPLGFPAFL